MKKKEGKKQTRISHLSQLFQLAHPTSSLVNRDVFQKAEKSTPLRQGTLGRRINQRFQIHTSRLELYFQGGWVVDVLVRKRGWKHFGVGKMQSPSQTHGGTVDTEPRRAHTPETVSTSLEHVTNTGNVQSDMDKIDRLCTRCPILTLKLSS